MRNVLVEASAGTGKTQALARRLIDLLREGVPPQEIVALTFSRAAAGEIFGRFVALLAEDAERSPADAALLRSVLATQHLSQVGTLDSFLMRVVRAFPTELGLSGDVRIMDEYEAKRAREAVSFAILRRTDESLKRTFLSAFSQATDHQDPRSFVASYRTFIEDWQAKVAARPEASAWGDPMAIWGRDPAFAHVAAKELAAAADKVRAALGDDERWGAFADWVSGFRGSFSGAKGFAKKLVEDAPALFASEVYSFTFSRKEHALTREQTLAVRDALLCVFGYVVRMKLELARGVRTVVSAFDRDYDRKVRRRGRLVFDDLPRLLSALPEASRLALEFRLDARIRAWALDEFQDTSREQWGALENLVDEALQSGGEKSVFVVGDRKQAIYGWRDGDVGIFAAARDSGLYDLGELRKTYRSGKAVVAAVNRIFAYGPVKDAFPAWNCPEHETARPGLDGFVRTAEAAGRSQADFVEPVFDALKASLGLEESDPRRRGVTAAVLVRGNEFGELLARELRARGLRGVVWEGESSVVDTPALSGFLDLVQLADHPGDAVVYRHFLMTPLAAAMHPDGVPPAEELSLEMARAFTTRGLARTLRELRAQLPASPAEAWSEFTETRFTDLLRAAAEFELVRDPGDRLSDFARYLGGLKRRTLAEEGKIRVMTIHRSKGLGFDYVVLPLYEHEALAGRVDGPLVGDGWVLPDPGHRVAQNVTGLEDAAERRKDRLEQEALCVCYVAMTRAKRSMTLVLQPAAKTQTDAVRFSDLVRAVDLSDLANPTFSFAAKKDDAGAAKETTEKAAPAASEAAPARRPRRRVARRLPSAAFADGASAGSLFASAEGRAAARRRGVEAHAEAAKVEFSSALPKPPGFVALWRERAFEVFADGSWTSGRFDRVTFFRDADGKLCAEVVDFKPSADDAGRYEGQLAAYRRAVTALTGIPPERVTSRVVALPSLA